MATKKKNAEKDIEIHLPGTSGEEFGDGEIGQIRNLLMGEQNRAMVERVNRVESELLTALDDMAKQIDARLKEINKRLDTESSTREGLEIDLRSDIERQSTEIRHQIGSAQMELKDQIENVDASLRERHVDRYTLAGFFEQAAANLNRDQ